MKKPNFDFSKAGLQKFFLHHSEKVILTIAVVLTGVFFWIGFQAEVFTDKKPKELSQDADRAHAYMVRNTNWEQLKDFRKGDKTVDARIENSDKLVNLDQLGPNYNDGLITGVPTRSLAKRSDPAIIQPTELMARTFTATLLVNSIADKPADRTLRSLPVAGTVEESDDDSVKRKPREAESSLGVSVPEYQTIEKNGVRPGRADGAQQAIVRNINVVTGVIDMDAQWKEFESLQNSLGYYPPRDKPVYRYLQVERWDSIGKKYIDITADILKKRKAYAGNFPAWGFVGKEIDVVGQAGPELIAAEHYNPVITGPMPTFTQFDYSAYASHAGKTKLKMRALASATADNKAADLAGDQPTTSSPFGSGDDEPDSDAEKPKDDRGGRGGVKAKPQAGPARQGSDGLADYVKVYASAKKQTNFKLVRFYDILGKDVKPGTSFKYRIRVWLNDPNNEPGDGVVTKKKKGREGDKLTMGGGGGAGAAGMEGPDEGRGRNKGGGGSDPTKTESYTYVKAENFMKLDSVRQRVMKSLSRNDLPDDLSFLKYARTAVDDEGKEAWSAETNEVTIKASRSGGFVYAGDVKPPKKYKIKGKLVDAGERQAKLAVLSWNAEIGEDKRSVGIPVPGERLHASLSDVLDFVTDARLMHPLNETVLQADHTTIKSSTMVVDIMGGDEVKEISSKSSGAVLYKMNYKTPGEVLVFDFANGDFHVQNDMKDKRNYLHSLFHEDEGAAIGGRKKKKDDDDDKDDKDDKDGGDNDPF